MSSVNITVTGVKAKGNFTALPIGKHVGTIIGIQKVFTKPEKTGAAWQDSSEQIAIQIETPDGKMTFFQPNAAFVRDTDTADIDQLLKNMSPERLKLANISITAWKKLTRDQKFAAMFDVVPCDKYSAKHNYIVFKHGDRTRVESKKANAADPNEADKRYEKDVLPILSAIPVTLGLCDEGEEFNFDDLVSAPVGFEVGEGAEGNKIKWLMSVEQASA